MFKTRIILYKGFLFAPFLFICIHSFSQSTSTLKGFLSHSDSATYGFTIKLSKIQSTLTDSIGRFEFKEIPFGRFTLEVYNNGTRCYKRNIHVDKKTMEVHISLASVSFEELDEVMVNEKINANGIARMAPIRKTAIFEAKKNELLVLKNIDANLAINNARQIFAKVPGTNVWENDGSGIQLNVSSRGLSPNRSWEYNMRQNDYDIAADILGYPDMYYSPPMDAIANIEVVRGSASLQYGTQMGGLLNFVLKEGSKVKPLEIEMKQSLGSYGLFSSYNSIGGTKNKWRYFGYFNHRSGEGWRENSDYKWNTGYGSVFYKANEKLEIGFEYTRMDFLLHLSAGLTDSNYLIDSKKSVRERNWFKVSWNIPAVKMDYKISNSSRLTLTSFMLIASRSSIENTMPVNIIADTGYRDLRVDHYKNFGAEVRYLNEYNLSDKINGALAGGIRFYHGRTLRGQGKGSAAKDHDFTFNHPDNLEFSDYNFRNVNVAVFVENVFRYGKLSVVPGIRYEYIKFLADGYFNSSTMVRIDEKGLKSQRRFPLLGVGAEYKMSRVFSLYANYTQGFRSANFNDIRINIPNLVIDANLKDSKGYNIDFGLRGKYKNYLSFDVNGFYLGYNDRIGLVTRTRPDNSTYSFSTNIANSRNIGIESFGEIDFMRAFRGNPKMNLSLFASYSFIKAEYLQSEKDFLKGKKVETVPSNILRTGITFKVPNFSSTINYSFIGQQFSDANNTLFTATGSNGIVPAYQVMDWSTKFSFNIYRVGLSVNNLTNNKYFTRRAVSYPGPGIIPADPVTFLISFEVKL